MLTILDTVPNPDNTKERIPTGGPIGDRSYPAHSSGGTYDHYLRTPFVHRRLEQPDVVIDVTSGMTYFTPLWRRRPVVLMATHVHLDQWGIMFPRPIATLGRFLEGRAAPFVYRNSLVLSPSDSSTDDLVELGYPRGNVRPVPVPVEARPSAVPRSPTPIFIAVGRLVPYKRIDLLFEMWERVRPVTGGELVIVGDGPDRVRLEGMLPPGARLTGLVSEQEKSDLMAAAWILLHPSHHEGWGIVITEAGRHRLPSIGFDVPGVRDAIVHGRSGLVTTDPDDFSSAWIELAAAGDQRDRLGRGAEEVAHRHDGPATMDAIEQALTEAIERRDRR